MSFKERSFGSTGLVDDQDEVRLEALRAIDKLSQQFKPRMIR